MFLNKLDFSNVWLSKLRKKSINRLFLIAQARSKDCALWACSGRILGIFLACLGILGRTWACVLVRDWQNASKCGHNGQKVVPKCGLKHAQVWARFGELGCTCHAWAGVLLTADRSFIDKTHVLWVFNYRELFYYIVSWGWSHCPEPPRLGAKLRKKSKNFFHLIHLNLYA